MPIDFFALVPFLSRNRLATQPFPLPSQTLSYAPMSPLFNKGFLSRKEHGRTILANKSNHCSLREGGEGREPG